jgi:hypothetical protein
MPGPVSDTRISTAPRARSACTSTRPPGGVNLTALASRFQTTCWSRSGSPRDLPDRRRHVGDEPDLLGLGGGAHDVQRRLHDRPDRGRDDAEPELAGADPADVEQVLNQLRLRPHVPLDHVQPVTTLVVEPFHPQQLRPPEDRVQRRAELVREGREELVLDPVRLPLLREQRVFDRDRRHLRELHDQRLVVVRERSPAAPGRRRR